MTLRMIFSLPGMAFVGLLLALTSAPARAQDFVDFQSPSGNIHCYIYATEPVQARCDIIAFTPSFPARPAACNLDWGHAFVVELTGEGLLGCVGDTAINPSAPVLAYGDYVQAGGLTCLSETTGISCRNPSGGGFTVSRAAQKIF